MLVFWLVTPRGLVRSPENGSSIFLRNVRTHDVTSQKTNIDIFTAVRISNMIAINIRAFPEVINSYHNQDKKFWKERILLLSLH
jgi:hypothetical protein